MYLLWLILIIKIEIFFASGKKLSCCVNNKSELICIKDRCSTFNYTNFGKIVITDKTVSIIATKKQGIAKSVAYEGLKVFKNFNTLNIEVGVSLLTKESFPDSEVEVLKVTSNDINKCTFGRLSKLKNLTIKSISNDISFHKDVFSGLNGLDTLEFVNIKTIFTYPVNTYNNQTNIACKHYLCALKNLTKLRMQIFNFPCELTFSGISEKTEIFPFSYDYISRKEKDSICYTVRNDCHYDDNLRCGQKEVCKNEVNVEVASGSVVFVSVIVLIAIIAVLGTFGIVMWIYHAHSALEASVSIPVGV